MVLKVSAGNPNGGTYDAGYQTASDIYGNVLCGRVFQQFHHHFRYSNIDQDQFGQQQYNMFLVKYDPAGSLSWATKAGGSDGNNQPQGIVIDGTGNIYLTGVAVTQM